MKYFDLLNICAITTLNSKQPTLKHTKIDRTQITSFYGILGVFEKDNTTKFELKRFPLTLCHLNLCVKTFEIMS